jgi:lysozyme family protein
MSTPQDKDFLDSLAFDLKWEGGFRYEDISGDSGGPTKAGITWRDGNEWRREHGLTPLTITQARQTRLGYLTERVVDEIYYLHYWIPMKGADLPSPLDTVLFDAAVNMGCAQSVKLLQRVLGVADDGKIGPVTIAAVNRYISLHGQDDLIEGLLQRRRDFYRQIAQRGSNGKFLVGWLNRVRDLAALVKARLAAK